MTIEKLERVMERLRKHYQDVVPTNQFRIAIMKEIGTDERTYYKTRAAMIKLGWIKKRNPHTLWITNKDIEES